MTLYLARVIIVLVTASWIETNGYPSSRVNVISGTASNSVDVVIPQPGLIVATVVLLYGVSSKVVTARLDPDPGVVL